MSAEGELPVFEGDTNTDVDMTTGESKEGDSHVSYSSGGWEDLMLRQDLIEAIHKNGFEHPSPVQHKAIPLILNNKNVIVQGKSGMGKTAVFVLSILQKIDRDSSDVQAVVISPTRELAVQTYNEFGRFSKYLNGVRVYDVLGGQGITSADLQKEYIRSFKPQIISATTGRLLDLVRKGAFDPKTIKYLVVDECDQMFSPHINKDGKSVASSMHEQFQEFFEKTSKKKQVMMFSATIPEPVLEICHAYMRDGVECFIDQGDKLMLEGMTQRFIHVAEEEKPRILSKLLDEIRFDQCIIFVKDNSSAEHLAGILKSINFPATFSHARVEASERIERYKKFKHNEYKILVATGLWDRSLDIERVNLVISFDLPPYDNKDEYLHRIGRAGRFGTKGLAIAFVANKEDEQYLEDVQKKFNKSITELKSDEEIDPSWYTNA